MALLHTVAIHSTKSTQHNRFGNHQRGAQDWLINKQQQSAEYHALAFDQDNLISVLSVAPRRRKGFWIATRVKGKYNGTQGTKVSGDKHVQSGRNLFYRRLNERQTPFYATAACLINPPFRTQLHTSTCRFPARFPARHPLPLHPSPHALPTDQGARTKTVSRAAFTTAVLILQTLWARPRLVSLLGLAKPANSAGSSV